MDKLLAISKMSRSLETYRQETTMLFEQGSNAPATIGDIEELSRQVFYVLNDFKKAIEAMK